MDSKYETVQKELDDVEEEIKKCKGKIEQLSDVFIKINSKSNDPIPDESTLKRYLKGIFLSVLLIGCVFFAMLNHYDHDIY